MSPDGRASRLVTLFHEKAALTSAELWLRKLHHHAAIDKTGAAQRRLDAILQMINHGLLHGDVALTEITPEGVYFKTPFSPRIPIDDLSDGYRTVLALTLDLLRHVEHSFDIESVLQVGKDGVTRITAEGVVLIDEIDAHLHPSWQRAIGPWLHDRFPNIQFIVATHSPLIATRCLREYRRRARTQDVAAAWKAFRESACGRRWFHALLEAYGDRCLYCDHAPGRTIDHVRAKSVSATATFAWDNHRPCCGDCNHLKGIAPVVDPVTEDPRAIVVFDVTTGRPGPSPALKPRQRRKGESTRKLLDHQTLNDARRAKLHRVLDLLVRFLDGERGYGAARVRAELAEVEPHRAIVRDLVLGARRGADEHQWAPVVRKALRRMPELETWAVAPLG
jgi:hypothetical protein